MVDSIVTSSNFQTFVIGAEQPVGQSLVRSLNSQGLMYKSIALESRDKLPAMSGGRPFFVITPVLSTDGFAHAAYWLEKARELDATVVVLSSLALFNYRADRQVTEDCDDFADTDIAAGLLQLESCVRDNERHIILRTGQLLSLQSDDFASRILQQARENLLVEADMQRLFDPTPVDDVADVIMAIIRQLVCCDELFGTYHFSGVESVSSFAFAEVILAQSSQYEDLTQVELKSQEGGLMPEIWTAESDNTLLFHTFGIKEKAWRQGVGRLLKRYYRVEDTAG